MIGMSGNPHTSILSPNAGTPDSYACCFTGVGRERIVRAEITTIAKALTATKPRSIRTGKYARNMASQTS